MEARQETLQVKASDEELKGRFVNAAQVTAQDDYFYLDFFVANLPVGQLVGRVFMTPGHMKRLYGAIGEQLEAYERNNGSIESTKGRPIGFDTSRQS